jgi:hypothetical protein
MEMDDVLGWHYDSKGRFSVKSVIKCTGKGRKESAEG